MAEKIALELDINAKGATTSLGQLEQEAERLNEELRKVPLGSKAFKDLKKELTGVSREIKNTELSMEALDNEQVASELGSVAGAVGDMSAAFVLLGGGGGAVEETVQNIEKAIGISMAFKGAIEGTQSMMKLLNNSTVANTVITKANTAATKLAKTAMKLLGITVKQTSRSFKVLKGAIAASGIGLLVAVLGEVVSMTMDWFDNSDELEKELADLTETLKGYRSELTRLNKEIDTTTKKEILNAKIRKANAEELRDIETNALRQKLKNFQIEEERLSKLLIKNRKNQEKAALIKEQLEENTINKVAANNALELKLLDNKLQTTLELEEQLKEQKDQADKEEAERLEKIRVRNEAEKKAAFELMLATKTANAESLQDFIDIENFKLKHLIKTSQLTKSERELAEFNTQQAIEKIKKDFAERGEVINNKSVNKQDQSAADARAKKIEQNAKEAQDLADFLLDKEELENEFFDRKLSKEQIEINAVRDKYNTLIEQAKIFGEDSKTLEEAQQTEINEIKKRFADEEEARQLAILERNKQFSIDTTTQLLNTFADLSQQTVDRFNRMNNTILNNEKLTNKEKSKLLAANNKRAKKAFDRQKAAQIAGALMTTYASANSAYHSQFKPVADLSSPVRGAIAASAAILAGLANVNKIRQQKFEAATLAGGGGGGGYDGGGGAPLLAPANTNTLVPQNNTRVFVTETDITATQNQVAVIQGQATIR